MDQDQGPCIQRRLAKMTGKADLRGLGQPKFGPFIRPLDISLMNRGINTGLDIGSVKLLAPDGTNLLLNSDFWIGIIGFNLWRSSALAISERLRVLYFHEGGSPVI